MIKDKNKLIKLITQVMLKKKKERVTCSAVFLTKGGDALLLGIDPQCHSSIYTYMYYIYTQNI